MADASNFAKLVPGFDFLQNLVKGAGAALPNIGQWVAPTLNPEEIEKRIEELRTVQFWLEQNARMISATIQALEVQRMTLSTLQTMNVQMGDLRESMKIRLPEMAPPKAPDPAPARAVEKPPEEEPPQAAEAEAAGANGAPASGLVDPMQWWGALTKQFTELASKAIKDGAADAAKNLAGAMAKQSFEAAGESLRKAVTAPMKAAAKAGSAAPRRAPAKKRKPATKAAPKP